jgi:glutamate-ammonia-ligase adenylyltransferase
MDNAHYHPIISPEADEPLEQYLQRAAIAYRWPELTRADDCHILAELVLIAGSEESAKQVGAHLVRALSFAADSSMATRHLDRYVRTFGEAASTELLRLRDNSEHLHFLASFFAFSNYLSEIAIAHPDFLAEAMRGRGMNREKTLEKYRLELQSFLQGVTGDDLVPRLVLFKQRELLRIGIRDLRELAFTRELCRELSHLAEAIVEVVYTEKMSLAVERFGLPRSEEDGSVPGFCVYAMGKFGAGELNFSSDIDLIYVYDAEGQTDGVKGPLGNVVRRVSNHEFFNWLGREIARAINDHGPGGFLYRVDLRLRPEGANGPLARSRPSFAQYFAGQAGLWEKIAWLKARRIAGDVELAARFDKIVEQYVYFNNTPTELFPEVARLKRRIDFERLTEEGRELDIKRGIGGIREIEFIVAGLQLVNAEAYPELRLRPTLDAMNRLVALGFLDKSLARQLEEAYHLYRRIEHTLQMMHESQTHRMPPPGLERERLALRCGFLRHEEFERVLTSYREAVRREFDARFDPGDAQQGMTLADWLFAETEPPPTVYTELASIGLGDDAGFQSLRRLAVGTQEYATSAKGRSGFARLLPGLLRELGSVAFPRQAVHQFDQLLRSARGFSWVYDICLENPLILRLFLRVLGFGSLLGRMLVAHPEWLDEMFNSDGLRESRTVDAITREQRRQPAGLRDAQLRQLRSFKQIEGFLISVQEVLGICSSADAARRMTLLAEHVLREVVRIEARGDALPRFAVLGLGGLGDRQVHMAGDLDLAFVIESENHNDAQAVDRVCQGLIRETAALTPEGQLWKVDARLRPDGRSGPLVASRTRFLRYYSGEAGLWEWQVLTKARAVAGDLDFGNSVLGDLHDLYREQGAPPRLAAEILDMKRRIEESIKLPRTARADLKRGPGGVVDIEFLAQYLTLSQPGRSREFFPMTTEQILAHAEHRDRLGPDTQLFLLRHLELLRSWQRATRLLFETNSDYLPEDAEIKEAIIRAMADQLGSRRAELTELEPHCQRARRIFLEVLKTEEN